MHNYDPANKYKFQTRIGNWSEEWELDDTKKKDYYKNKGNQQLASIVKDSKTTFSMRPASITFPGDEFIHFGDHYQLRNHKTQGVLSIDIQERIKCPEEAFAVTTSQICQPIVRNVWVFVPYQSSQGNVLRYGQQFRIVANPRLSNNKVYYLHSLPSSPTRCSKISRKQEVCAIDADIFNTVWKLEHSDPKYRFEMEGEPVRYSDTVLIKHAFTQHWLASDEAVYQNDFGREREVFVHSFQCLSKTQNLISEKEGRTTIDIPLRNQETQNLWSFGVATERSQNFDESVADDSKNVHNLMNRLKQQILNKGFYGVRGLAKAFDDMDQNKNGVVEFDDFKWGLRNFGIELTEEETKVVFNKFDRNQNGKLEFREFIGAFRIPLNQLRYNMIGQAYSKIAQSGGEVTLETLGKAINVKKHPEVLKGYKTERQVFQEFVGHWDKANPKKVIQFEEFLDFYQDISSAIERDETFEAIVRNTWNI